MKTIKSFNFTPNDVANWFICHVDRDSGDLITHLKLQKMIYYAQAWSIAVFGKSLFVEDFEAWAHGPVLPVLFNQYKGYGFEAIPACDCKNNISEDVEELLFEVNDVYGSKSAKYLEELTHQEDPWQEAREDLPLEARCNNIISKESMQKFYGEKLVHNVEKQEK